LKKQSSLFNRKDLIAYFIIAGIGAVIQLLAGGLLKDWFRLSYEATILPAYFVSLIVGFILTKLFAFNARQTKQTQREMIKFLLVATFSGFVTWFFSVIPYAFIAKSYPDIIIQIPYSIKRVNITQVGTTVNGMGFSFISNYVLHKSFTFKSSGFYDRFKDLIK
jgi:putative flippase GtrA